MACISRTVEDVENLIEFAKLSKSSLQPTSQTLEFPDNYEQDKYILMQIPETLINTLKKGDKLILRGDGEDSAVLCSETETFEVREAETSNSLVLCPNLCLPAATTDITSDTRTLKHVNVEGIHFNYLEVRPCIPRLQKLRKLLHESPYTDSDADDSVQHRLYTFAELLERVQCSEDQLRDALQALPAMHLGGHWRVLEFSYQFGVVSSILELIERHDWPIDAVNRSLVMQHLKDTEPAAALNLCFDHFFTKQTAQDEQLFGIDDARIARLFAEVLLRPATKFNFDEFQTIWPQSVPLGVNTSLDQLAGIALVDRCSSPATICYYPAHQLSEDTVQRFSQLFDQRQSWSLADISPYISSLAGGKMTVSALLAKHTRAATVNGVRHYSAKHCN